MKYPAWLGQAVQALSIDGKANRRKAEDKRRNVQGAKANGVYTAQSELSLPTWTPELRIASEFSAENWRSAQRGSVVDVVNIWDIPVQQSAPSKIPGTMGGSDDTRKIHSPTIDNMPLSDISKDSRPSTVILQPGKDFLHDTPKKYDNKPAAVSSVSESVQSPNLLKRPNKGSSSTIFRSSVMTPITIIVTAPDEEVPVLPPPVAPPPPISLSKVRTVRSSSTASLPASRLHHSMSTDSLSVPDANRLMPPTEQQIDAHRLRKAHEFREIRKFLVSFMNAKGDQFPKKLRTRMMEAYGIDETDLSPETVAKFNAEIRDEGVALERLGISEGENTNAENLRILEMAFRSQIPEVTPKMEKAYVESIPLFRTSRRASVSRRPESRKREDDEGQLQWLGPLISASTSDLALPQQQQEHRLLKSSSVPNMHRTRPLTSDAPPLPLMPTTQTLASMNSGRERKSSVSTGYRERGLLPVEKQLRMVDQQTRIRRQNIISGAFGAVREAMGGTRSGKVAEKRRMMLEGR